MNFDFPDELKQLRDEARRFLTERCPTSATRRILEGPEPYYRPLWQAMAEMGWLGAAIPERYEGAGLGYEALCVLAEELGHVLAPVPFISTVCLAAEAILAVDLLGTALVLQEFGEVVAPGGAGVVIASMAGHMFPPLAAEQEKALAHNPPGELLQLDFISSITDPNFAYPIAKQANHIRVRAGSAHWGRRGARINSISPGIISTPMGQQELASPVGDGMRAMIAMSATGRLGTPDDIAAAAAFLLGPSASFITGTELK